MSTATPTRAARSSPETVTPAVAVSGLSKSYGGIRALIDMDLEVQPGTIHAVVGENGAGKSTLMKILAGAVRPDSGHHHGRWPDGGVRDAAGRPPRGIGIVYQELSLFPERSILANLFPDEQPTRFGLVDSRAMLRRAAPVLWPASALRSTRDTLVGRARPR